MFAIGPQTIFLAVAGSRAQGTAREGSDLDVRGVCVAPLALRLSLSRSFEQHEGGLPSELAPAVREALGPVADAPTECVIFDVAKHLRLCAAANPNALELLFADPRDWIVETPAWRRLYDARHELLTKKVQHTFHGYALAQLRKIRSHRGWLLDPPTEKPSRQALGLPAATGTLGRDDRHRIEEALAAKLRGYGVDDLEMPLASRVQLRSRVEALYRDLLAADTSLGLDTVGEPTLDQASRRLAARALDGASDDLDETSRDLATRAIDDADDALDEASRRLAARALGLPRAVTAVLDAERRYRAAMKRWEAYQRWKRDRNPARAELERRHGYDTKHAMHLIRLMRMGLEALECGELRVRREDADELVAIRDGAWSFDALLEAAAALGAAIERAAETTTLPDDVSPERVDALLLEVLRAHGTPC